MKFHVPSFLLGYGLGAASTALSERLRPLALEVAKTGYRLIGGLSVRLARKREAVEDFFAEARGLARNPTPAAELH
jgi:hypothetical protein